MCLVYVKNKESWTHLEHLQVLFTHVRWPLSWKKEKYHLDHISLQKIGLVPRAFSDIRIQLGGQSLGQP